MGKVDKLKLSSTFIHFVNVVLIMLPSFLFKASYEVDFNSRAFFSVLLVVAASLMLFSILIGICKKIFILFSSLLYTVNSLVCYFTTHYNITISHDTIDCIFCTDICEVLELINMSMIEWFLLTGILPIILLVTISKYYFHNTTFLNFLRCFVFSIVLSFSSIILLGGNAQSMRVISNGILFFMPYNYLTHIHNYYLINSRSLKFKDITTLGNFKVENDIKDVNIVLIIGESARADRWQLNGYSYQTNPILTQVKNLISFKNVYSLGTYTNQGVRSIMKHDQYNDYSSFITVLKKLGFATYWISNQIIGAGIIESISTEADKVIFRDSIMEKKIGYHYDENLLPYIKEIVSSNNQEFIANLIVIHTMGSHHLYDARYTDKFKKFQPTCLENRYFYESTTCTDIEKLSNSYNNTILYTDYFISEVIKIFQNKKTLLIYVSDHGESLGEEGIFMHGCPIDSAPKEQIHIPLIFWASESLLKNLYFSNKFMAIRQYVDHKIDQSFIFHSILDCAGITGDLINKRKSLCR